MVCGPVAMIALLGDIQVSRTDQIIRRRSNSSNVYLLTLSGALAYVVNESKTAFKFLAKEQYRHQLSNSPAISCNSATVDDFGFQI